MQQLMIVGYQPPHHYYSLLSAAVKPVVLHRFRPEGQAAELLDWLFPASLVLYDQGFHQEHRLINHELLVQRADGRPSNRPNHFVLTGSSGQFSYCSSQLFYERAVVATHCQGYRKYEQFQLPICIVVISSIPQWKLHERLMAIYHAIRTHGPSRLPLGNDCRKLSDSTISSSRASTSRYPSKSTAERVVYLPGEFLWTFYLSFVTGYAASRFNGKDVTLTGLQQTDSLTIGPQHETLFDSHSQQQPFELKMSAANIIRLLGYLLQEKQIIVVATQPNRCVYFCQTMLALIRPFSWQFLYVPNLPPHLLQVVDSFMPFFVGLPSHQLNCLRERHDLREKILVDIDRDLIQTDDPVFIPSIPQRLHYWILNCFTAEVNYMPPVKRQLRIKKNFLKMMLALLGDFLTPFERCPREHRIVFNQERYMQGISRSQHPFYSEFMRKTMMFGRFLQQIENLLSDRKCTESFVARQFLKLIILNRGSIDEPNNREVSEYLDARYAEVLRRISSPVMLDCEKSLQGYYRRFSQQGLPLQVFTVPLDMYEDAEYYENRRYIALKSSNSMSKLDQSTRMLSSTSSLCTSQVLYRL